MGLLWRRLLQAALLGQLAAATQLVAGARRAGAAAPSGRTVVPHLRAGPQLTPRQFLVASSRSTGKLVWCELRHFQTTWGGSFDLAVGLTAPAGLAFDPVHNFLFAADPGASSVYAYKLAVVRRRLVTVGNRVTLISNRLIDWLTIDPVDSGILFVDRNSSTINKISIAPDTMNELIFGERPAEYLRVVQAVSMPAEYRSARSKILELYSPDLSPDVRAPSAVMSDGMHLFWVNAGSDNGTSGDLVEAVDTPTQTANQMAPVVASGVALPRAIAASRTHMFWTGDSPEGSGAIFATRKFEAGERRVYRMLPAIGGPRGLAWDGDNTLYVADEAMGRVYSIPVGTVQEEPSVTQALAVPGAYGVAIVHE